MGRFVTLKKKSGPKYAWLQTIFWTLFFKVPDPKKISGRPDKLDIRVQIDWSNDSIKQLDSK